jgi:hypothetical protein
MSLLAGRQFQVWEYRVGQASLLIRSPNNAGFKTCVDVIFTGVEYMSLPNSFQSLEIRELSPEEAEAATGLAANLGAPWKVWQLEDGDNADWVIAGSMTITEHEGDMFDSPFGPLKSAVEAG